MHRETFVEVDLDALSKNASNIVKKYNNYKYYIGMVKANAYGHGMYIVNELIKSGINYFAVSSLDEALEIRKFNKEIPVLCVEPINVNSIPLAIKNNITLTIANCSYFSEFIKRVNGPVKVHIKVDTGMHRLGVCEKYEFNRLYNTIKEISDIFLEGVFTHFATPGVNDRYYDMQLQAFRTITEDVDLKTIPIIHLSSSFIVLAHPKIDIANGIRIGTILYGYDIAPHKLSNSPINLLKKMRNIYLRKKYNISKTYDDIKIDLTPALKIKSNILQLKHIDPGDKVGYGYKYTAKKSVRLATVPIGFDDGLGIHTKYVVIKGKRFRIIGEISMCMISVLLDSTIGLKDQVTILGDGITLGMIARQNHTSFHDVLVNLGKNLPKVYIKDGKRVAMVKYNRSEVSK